MILYKGILHTADFKVDEREAEEKKYTEADIEVIMAYMKAWDGVHVTLSNMLPEEFSVVGWPPEEEEKAREAIYLMEQDAVFGMYQDERERFEADWAAGEWEPSGSIIFPAGMVEIIGTLGEHSPEEIMGECRLRKQNAEELPLAEEGKCSGYLMQDGEPFFD